MRHLLCGLRDVKTHAHKNADGSDEMRFEGYGAYFDNIDAYGDAIAKGAFKRTLREAKKSGVWPAMLSQHGGWGITAQDLVPVGLWDTLDEDDNGLFAKGICANTPRGLEMYTLLAMQPRPAIDGLSIGYVPIKWKVNTNPKEGEPRRILTDVDLYEISLVTWPANTRARVTDVKSEWDKRAVEELLRREGMPRAMAKRIASLGMAGLESGVELERRDDADLASIADSLRATFNI